MPKTNAPTPINKKHNVIKQIIKFGAVGIIGLFLVITAALLVFQIPTVRSEIKGSILSHLAHRLQADIDIDAVSIDFLSGVTFKHIRIADDAGNIITLDQLSARLLVPLIFQKIVFAREVYAKGLRVLCNRYADGSTSLSRLFTPTGKTGDSDSAVESDFHFIIGKLILEDGQCIIRNAIKNDNKDRNIIVSHFKAAVDYRKKITIDIEDATVIEPSESPTPYHVNGELAYDPEKLLLFADSIIIRSGISEIHLTGEMRFQETIPTLDVRLDLLPLCFSDLPLRDFAVGNSIGEITGWIVAKGNVRKLSHSSMLTWKGSSFKAEGEVEIESSEAMDVTLSCSLNHLDPSQIPMAIFSGITGDIDADAKLNGRLSTDPSKIDAHLTMDVSLSNSIIGTIDQGRIDAEFSKGNFKINDLKLSAPIGLIETKGSIDKLFDGRGEKQIQLSASIKNLALSKMPLPKKLKGPQIADFDLTLDGVLPADLNPVRGRLKIAGGLKKIKPSPIQGEISQADILFRMENGDILIQEASVASTLGNLHFNGDVRGLFLQDSEKQIRLKARLTSLQPAVFFPKDKILGDINANVDVEAVLPVDMAFQKSRIRIAIDNGLSHMDDITIQKGAILAVWQNGLLTVESLRVDSDVLKVVGTGVVNPLKRSGRIEADVNTSDLYRLKRAINKYYPELLPTIELSGITRVKTILNGSADSADITLDCRGENLRIPPWKTRSLQMIGNWKGSLLTAEGDGRFTISIDDETENRFEAKGRLATNQKEIADFTLDTISFHPSNLSANETLRNVSPVHFQLKNGSLMIDGLKIQSEKAVMEFNGYLSRNGFQNFQISLADIELSRFVWLIPQLGGVKGSFSGKAELSGTTERPLIEANMRIDNFSGFNMSGGDLTLIASYGEEKSKWNISFTKSHNRLLTASGEIGLRFQLFPLLIDPHDGDTNFSVNTNGLRLSDLSITKYKELNFDAVADIQMNVLGPVSFPRISGKVKLSEGYLSLPKKGLTYETLAATINFNDKNVEIEDFLLKGDKEGRLHGSGTASLKGFVPTSFNINLVGKDFLIPYTKGIYARVLPKLKLVGTMESPLLTGEVEVVEGRMNLDKMTAPTLPEIHIIEDPNTQADERNVIADEIPSDFLKALRSAVVMKVVRNSWVKGQDIDTEITGEISLHKDLGKAFTLQGELNTVRGTYYFRGKHFSIENGSIQFFGLAEPNPDIRMKAVTQIQQVNIIINISGTPRKLTLALDSEPKMDQSDIISYLVFGKPTDSLKGGQAFNAEKAAMSFSGGLIASELRKLMGDVFFLDAFAVESHQNGGHSVSMSKYVRPNIFVTYRYGLQDEDPNQVEISYEVNPNIRIETQLGSDKNNGVDLFWEFNF
jgi:hypothetical protein